MANSDTLTKKDFKTDQEVRWCPGCGDYAILNAVQSVFAELGMDRSKTVMISGIGCSSRFPYYMNTYGFHSIHGRAPAVASGVKLANPEVDVWVATGDGDALSIGGNHLIHAMRRNLGLKILLFNNRIYGLTKGQYSPTSLPGHVTKSTPMGSLDNAFNPISLALGAGCTFVARTVDIFSKHLKEVIGAAAQHPGTAFVEIFQNCNIFNDGAWRHVTEKDIKHDRVLELRHGKPLLFGKDMSRGIKMDGVGMTAVDLGNGVGPDDCITWNAEAPSPCSAFMLSQLPETTHPVPIGVFRNVKQPVFDRAVHEQIQTATERLGEGDLSSLLYSGDTWKVK